MKWTITLTPETDNAGKFPVPVELRIRQLLKISLRRLGLRCVEVKQHPDMPAANETAHRPLTPQKK